MKIKIDKDIPITHTLHSGGRVSKYPFEDMEVGDSFLIKCTKAKSHSVAATLINSAKRVMPCKFTTKYVKEERGTRIWRIR